MVACLYYLSDCRRVDNMRKTLAMLNRSGVWAVRPRFVCCSSSYLFCPSSVRSWPVLRSLADLVVLAECLQVWDCVVPPAVPMGPENVGGPRLYQFDIQTSAHAPITLTSHVFPFVAEGVLSRSLRPQWKFLSSFHLYFRERNDVAHTWHEIPLLKGAKEKRRKKKKQHRPDRARCSPAGVVTWSRGSL